MKLVIVESPAKAKTINKYLGSDFKVKASFGHIRDLPSKDGSVLPDNDFEMKYVISDKAHKYIDDISNAASKAEIIYLATDPDREGESISWHVAEVLKDIMPSKDPSSFRRITFNEVTQKAVKTAIANARDIDINLVNAQQARRALDYLVGFTLSPLVWRKLPGCKSVGRVQSVALRLICEREEEIEKFVTKEYWDITLKLLNQSKKLFSAMLTHIDGEKLEKFTITNEKEALAIQNRLQDADFFVQSIEKKQQKRNPPPPFITSSLQQEAARKLGFSAKKTMHVAQKLYEGLEIGGSEPVGLITYMRTDGVSLSTDAVDKVRELILRDYSLEYLPDQPRVYKSKLKNAQEAHEAIRPTDIMILPEQLKTKIESDQYKLYNLIWQRTVACQMSSVVIDIVTAHLCSKDNKFQGRASGSTIVFDGFYALYREGKDDEKEEESSILPPLKVDEELVTKEIIPAQHFTEHPPRYSEASLVKKLEELGIGRPSTYATILSVLQERKYVTLTKKRFFPSELGRLLTVFLKGYFEKYVEYDFTARLEDELDEVAVGKLEWKALLTNFWGGFNSNISSVKEYKTADVISHVEKELEYHLFGSEDESARNCKACSGGKLHLKLGKFGAFLACSNYPECTFKKPIIANTESDEQGVGVTEENNNKLLGTDKTGTEVFLKKGPYGWYVQLGEGASKTEKPKRASLPTGVTPDKIEINLAIKLLDMPLKLGIHPETKEEISIGIGKYGPYIKHSGKFVSVPKSIDIFSMDLQMALKVLEDAAAKASKKKG